MKVKDARKVLEGLSGEELYRKAREMYEFEIDQLIYIRSHGTKITVEDVGLIESVVKQVADWFRKVYPGLAWENEKTPLNIIAWESGEAYVRNNVLDPKLKKWGERTRRGAQRGVLLPAIEAMTPGDLEAASGMMMASVRRDVMCWSEINKKRKAFVEKYGLKECPYGAEERFCKHQKTYVMDKDKVLPTSTDDLVFVCAVEECDRKKPGEQP